MAASAHIELDITVASKGGDSLATCSVRVPLAIKAAHVGDQVVLDADTGATVKRIEAGLAAFKAAVEK